MDQKVASGGRSCRRAGRKFVRPANDHCTEIHYIPLMAIIPRRDLYFAMRYWEHSSYQRVREEIEEEAGRTLYISNLPSDLCQSELTGFLSGFRYPRCGWRQGDAYALVIFETLEEATRAYGELAGGKLGDSVVWLSWKIPNTIVYIMNIKRRTPSSRIRGLLEGYRLYGNLVRRPHMMIAAFRDPAEAEMAVSRWQGTSVDGELLYFSVLRGQRASEFVGYDHSLSCHMCLRTLKSGARTVTITATPPLSLALAVESPIYYELSFDLGEYPQITLHDSQVLPTVTSRDIALRIRSIGHPAFVKGSGSGAGYFVRLMEILQRDVSNSGGMMDVGVVLEDPLDALKVEAFFGESVPPASRAIPGIWGESQPHRGDTAGESSDTWEGGGQRSNVLYTSAFDKPESSRRASAGNASDKSPWPGVNGVPLGGGVNKKSGPHDSVGTKGLGGETVLSVGVAKPERRSPGYPLPTPGGAFGVSSFSDPRPKVRQTPFSSAQPTGSIMRPLEFSQRRPDSQLLLGGGENTPMSLLKDSRNGEEGLGVVEAMEGQEVDAPPGQMDERGNGSFLPEAHTKRSSSDSASSSWSFLHRSYNSQTILSPSSSSASVGSVGESVTQAFGQMQYADDSGSEATESAPTETVDLTVDNGKVGGKSDKSGNSERGRRKIPIVDSSGSDSQSELESRAAKARRERLAHKKNKKRKEKVPPDESVASENRGGPLVVQRGKHKSGKKGKGKEIAHSDESMEFQGDQDEPGPSKPTKRSSKNRGFSKRVGSASGHGSPALLEVKMEKGKKKKKAEGAEEVREGSDVDMDASCPPTKHTHKKRRDRRSSVSESEDAIRPLIEDISGTHVTRSHSTSHRPKPPTNTSSSNPGAKKRKRRRTSSPSPTPAPIPPPPADLSPSPARPGESMDTAFRRREINEKIHRINLQQHELSVLESGLRHELKELGYQARVNADVQGVTYMNCICSACGEYGHRRNNFGCKRHPRYRDWYPER